MTRFKLTEKSLKKLKNEGVPENITDDLESLKDRKYKNKADFADALKKTLGKNQADKYKTLIYKNARTRFQKIKDAVNSNSPPLTIIILIVLFLFAYQFNNVVISIYPGQAGVLYLRFFGGTVVDKVYGEGIHLIFPWDKMYVYNVRIQEYYHEFDVLTKNGLSIHLKISIRYQPEYELLGILHVEVGPDYLKKVVIPEIESVLRVIIGQIAAQEVYTTKTSLIQQSLNTAIEQVSQRFVKVDDVIIKRITLPTRVQEMIQYKLEQKHLAEAYIFKIEREKREAERKRIEAEGFNRYNEILSKSLSPQLLDWRGIEAALELSKSVNTKVVVIGNGKRGLPIWGSLVFDAPENSNHQGTAGSGQKAVGSGQQAVGSGQPAAGSGQSAAGNQQPASGIREPATGNLQPGFPLFTPETIPETDASEAAGRTDAPATTR